LCYRHLFPQRFNLNKISYYFDHDMSNVVDEEHYADLLDRVAQWQGSWTDDGHPTLSYRKAISNILIEDGRRRKARTYSYAGGLATLYEYCTDARTPRVIAAAVGTQAWVQEALDDFIRKDLMLFLDRRYLSLALPQNPNFDLSTGPSPAGIAAGARGELVVNIHPVPATAASEVGD